jgi:hypothetical protein
MINSKIRLIVELHIPQHAREKLCTDLDIFSTYFLDRGSHRLQSFDCNLSRNS